MLLVNPRQTALWQSHVILNGRGRDYFVPNFPGPLSIKSVVSGTATWETDEGRFEVCPGSCLVLNDRQPYSITIESKTVVETLCVFFSQGFVEDAARAMTKGDAELLADPWKDHAIEFHERVRADDRALIPLLRKLHRTNDEELIWQLAEALVKIDADMRARAEKLPAIKRSTREELWRRIQRGRNVMEGSLDQALELRQVAREAALSPYHFHRRFTQMFGETPSAYLMRRRMERAAGLLRSTNMPVTEVCLACGYQSLGSFSSLFRRQIGISPTEFRRAKN
jgi:AraC family transcriptional regulator